MESTTDFEKLLFLYKTEGKNRNKIGFVSPARRNEAPVCCTAVENVI